MSVSSKVMVRPVLTREGSTIGAPLLAVGRSSLSADYVTVGGRKALIAFGGFELLGSTPVASAAGRS